MSLLGFLFAGLLVFGVVEGPSGWDPVARPDAPASEKSLARPMAEAAPAAIMVDQRPVPPPARPAGVGPADAPASVESAGAPVGKSPRFIGGSLPVYGVADSPQPDMGAAHLPRGSGFRPPAEQGVPTVVEPTREDLLQQARRAFWNGDFEAAEVAYINLIADYPDDADAFGELGNLYQSMARPTQALDAFYEAGVRLKAVGELEKLKGIIEILSKAGDERAASLGP